MAYYIFLKSLRSLEEFRKNPHIKIPPKSSCANFQSLGKFKNPIFNSQILFVDFGPASSLIFQPSRGPPPPSLSGPVGPSPTPLVRFGRRLPLADRWAHPVSEPRVVTFIGQRLSSPSPPPLPGHRAPPSSTPRVPPDRYHLAFIFPPLNRLSNPPRHSTGPL
jgi:hypothetical protein